MEILRSGDARFSDEDRAGAKEDIERGECVLVRGDTREKIGVKIEEAAEKSLEMLERIRRICMTAHWLSVKPIL